MGRSPSRRKYKQTNERVETEYIEKASDVSVQQCAWNWVRGVIKKFIQNAPQDKI